MYRIRYTFELSWHDLILYACIALKNGSAVSGRQSFAITLVYYVAMTCVLHMERRGTRRRHAMMERHTMRERERERRNEKGREGEI